MGFSIKSTASELIGEEGWNFAAKALFDGSFARVSDEPLDRLECHESGALQDDKVITSPEALAKERFDTVSHTTSGRLSSGRISVENMLI